MVVIASAVDIDYTFRRNDMNTYGYNNIIIISNYRIIIMMIIIVQLTYHPQSTD